MKYLLSFLFVGIITILLLYNQKSNAITIFSFIFTILFIIDMFIGKEQGFYFILGNPNTIGAIALFLSIIEFFEYKNEKKSKNRKKIYIMQMIVLFGVMLLSKSRTAVMLMLIFYCFNLIVGHSKNKKQSARILIKIIIVMAILVTLYFLFFQNSLLARFINKVSILLFGKALDTGRIDIIKYLFSLKLPIITGFGNVKLENILILKFDLMNAHNMYVEILFSFGIIALILYIFMLQKIYRYTLLLLKDGQYWYIISFVVILMYNFFESSMFAATRTDSFLQLFIIGIICSLTIKRRYVNKNFANYCALLNSLPKWRNVDV